MMTSGQWVSSLWKPLKEKTVDQKKADFDAIRLLDGLRAELRSEYVNAVSRSRGPGRRAARGAIKCWRAMRRIAERYGNGEPDDVMIEALTNR